MGVLAHRDYNLKLLTSKGHWAITRHPLNKRGERPTPEEAGGRGEERQEENEERRREEEEG